MSPVSSTESYPAFSHIGLRKIPEKTPTRPVLSNIIFISRSVCKSSQLTSTLIKNTLYLEWRESAEITERSVLQRCDDTTVSDSITQPHIEGYIKVNDIRASKKINTFASAHISQFRYFDSRLDDESFSTK
ncbi:hypothetical protein ANN_20357 [Periplaneta americana]|uniref:Uncharacterized protein n=1 Tax=Periplaneta americana TaxID=6978 RepID=A0ABQ8SDP0_PERAM|nr:hypothetical protein ANN_20357 [Periplaneta americana]